MPACSLCGVDVRFAQTTYGTKIKLERIPSPAGPNRFMDVSFSPDVVKPVTEKAACLAYPLHNCQKR